MQTNLTHRVYGTERRFHNSGAMGGIFASVIPVWPFSQINIHDWYSISHHWQDGKIPSKKSNTRFVLDQPLKPWLWSSFWSRYLGHGSLSVYNFVHTLTPILSASRLSAAIMRVSIFASPLCRHLWQQTRFFDDNVEFGWINEICSAAGLSEKPVWSWMLQSVSQSVAVSLYLGKEDSMVSSNFL